MSDSDQYTIIFRDPKPRPLSKSEEDRDWMRWKIWSLQTRFRHIDPFPGHRTLFTYASERVTPIFQELCENLCRLLSSMKEIPVNDDNGIGLLTYARFQLDGIEKITLQQGMDDKYPLDRHSLIIAFTCALQTLYDHLLELEGKVVRELEGKTVLELAGE